MRSLSALVLISFLAVGCGGSGSPSTHRKTLVQMTAGDTFSPQTVTVGAGSTVRWTNGDVDPHTVESDTGTPGLDSDEMFPNGLPPGASFEWDVPSSAVSGQKFFYHCRFHGTQGNGSDFGTGMTGVVIVQ